MARHADPNDHSFQRSLARAAGRALLLLALVGALTAGVARLGAKGGGDDDVTRPPGGPLSATTSPSESPVDDGGDVLDDLTETPRETVAITPVPSEPPVPDDAPTPTEEPGVPPATEAGASVSPVPAGMTVQVLDGVGDGERTRSAARRLEELGYEVVAVNVSSRQAADTSVLYTEGNRAAAEQLVATDPRFGTVGANDRFAADVTLHVVIGVDWPA